MATTYTVGQVSRITDIDTRTLKYYVERGLIVPSSSKAEGKKKSWLYSESDIFKIRQIALYHELGYCDDYIKRMLSAPDLDWRKVLDEQIGAIKQKKRHLENQLLAAEFLRYIAEIDENPSEVDITFFDNDIDAFASSAFSADEEELASRSIDKVSKDFSEDITIAEVLRQGQQVLDLISDVGDAMEHPPESNEMQESLSRLFSCFRSLAPDANIGLNDLLFAFRIGSSLSVDRIFDLCFSREGSADYLATALQKYCDNHRGKQ